MKSNRESVKKKIIQAALACIEKNGVESVTTRNVAKEAGVNIAAINYYFGTKDTLLKETFKKTLNHFARDLEVITSQKNLTVYSMLKVFLVFILQGSLRYPNIMKILLIDNINSSRYSKEFIQKINLFMKNTVDSITKPLNGNDNRTARVSLMQMFYAVLTPGLMISITKELFGINLSMRENQLFYIDYLLQHYLTWIKRGDIEKEEVLVNNLIEQLFNSPDSVWED